MRKNDQTLERRIVLEIDGPGVSPETVDAPVVLDLAASFFLLVRGNAAEATQAISLRGLEVIDKCMGIAVPVDAPELVWPYVEEARRQLLGQQMAPRGLGSIVERGRAALRKLPHGQTARVLLGERHSNLALDDGSDQQPLDSILSVRAVVMRVGGRSPAVRFVSQFEDEPFTLQVSRKLARELGSMLYQEVDIEARVSRDADGKIERGKLERFDPVDGGDPRPAWRDWFKAVNGEVEPEEVKRTR